MSPLRLQMDHQRNRDSNTRDRLSNIDMNQPENPLDKITTLKEGWQYFLDTFREVIPKGDEYKFEGAWYAGSATYDAILFNTIKAADKSSDAQEGDTVQLNITDNIFALHGEVSKFAKKRVRESEAAIEEEKQQEGPQWIYKRN